MRITPPGLAGLFVVCVAVAILTVAVPVGAVERAVPTPNYPTIQSAIDACADGDEVVIAPGRYRGDGNRDLDFAGRAITVRGTDPNDWTVVSATVIDCDGTEDDPHRGFYFHTGEDPNAVVAGLTITRGYAARGGGIHCDGGVGPTITNCAIVRNACENWGGGIYLVDSSAVVINCLIRRNGVYTTTSFGGGGGICMFGDGASTVSNCVVTDNFTVAYGPTAAAILCGCDRATIANCTICSNRSENLLAGVVDCSSPNTVLTNCIVWDDPAATPLGTIGDSPTVTYSNIQGGWPGEGNIDADPCFSPLEGDYHLMPGSPCIDTGTNGPPGGLPATDIDGSPRPVDGDGDTTIVVDMGAYEKPGVGSFILAQPNPVVFSTYDGGPTPDAASLGIANGGEGTLAWTVQEDAGWLDATPSSGESMGDVDEVTLTVDIETAGVGDHECLLRVLDPNATNHPRTIAVRLFVRQPRRVPSEYATIQAAIDEAEQYDTVLLAEGTHRGPGNRDVDFRGKSILVHGEGGPESCIIDCEGQGRGFYFHPACPRSVDCSGMMHTDLSL